MIGNGLRKMIIWLNGAFGAGKTQTAYELKRRIPGSVIYDKERTEFKVAGRDEVFVHPDNWGSDGVKGPIAKTEIKGKVLGYDLHGVTNTMKQDELNMYSMVQEMIQKIKTTDYKDNTVTTFLTGVTPQTIAKLYYYAAYKENYEMMYALYARKEGAPPAYGRWLQNQRAQTQSMLQHNLVKIYYVDHSTLSKERSQLKLYDDAASNLVFKLRMKEEDGVWKVLYATVSNNR